MPGMGIFMKSFLKAFGLSLFDAIVTIIMLIAIVRLKLSISGIYIAFSITALLFPLTVLVIYYKIFGREKLFVAPLSFLFAAAYSLGVSLYCYYGDSSFSDMFKGLMYFIYFLPSMIYCGIGWIVYAIINKLSREPRRREI